MSIWKRRNDAVSAADGYIEPPLVAGPAELDRLRTLLHQYEDAQIRRSDAETRRVVRGLANLAGQLDQMQILNVMGNHKEFRQPGARTDFLWDRNWRWLAHAAGSLEQADDPTTLGRLAFFVWIWNRQFQPNLTMADQMDLLFTKAASPQVRRTIFSAFLRSSAALDPTTVITAGDGQQLTVEALRSVVEQEVGAA